MCILICSNFKSFHFFELIYVEMLTPVSIDYCHCSVLYSFIFILQLLCVFIYVQTWKSLHFFTWVLFDHLNFKCLFSSFLSFHVFSQQNQYHAMLELLYVFCKKFTFFSHGYCFVINSWNVYFLAIFVWLRFYLWKWYVLFDDPV